MPYIVFWAVIIASGIISDKILAVKPGVDVNDPEVKEKLIQKRKNVRRIFNGIGNFCFLPSSANFITN